MTSGFTDDDGSDAVNHDAVNHDAVGDVDAVDDVAVDPVRDDEADARADVGVAGDAADEVSVEDTRIDEPGAADAAAADAAAADAAADAAAADDARVDDLGAADDGPQAATAGDEGEADIEEEDGPGVRASLEAILLVADEPVPEVLLAQVLERPRGEIDAALRALAAEYTADGRGFDLREIAGGWRFYTREDCAPLVERFVRDGQEVRLTQAALETLAVIAYRQPVSRARVSAVRGVNCDGVIRTLVLRGLVEDSGTDQETGAILYRTTGYFLERLGMASLDELPDLAPFLPENIEDIEDNERTRA